jgi:hypothetical protein
MSAISPLKARIYKAAHDAFDQHDTFDEGVPAIGQAAAVEALRAAQELIARPKKISETSNWPYDELDQLITELEGDADATAGTEDQKGIEGIHGAQGASTSTHGRDGSGRGDCGTRRVSGDAPPIQGSEAKDAAIPIPSADAAEPKPVVTPVPAPEPETMIVAGVEYQRAENGDVCCVAHGTAIDVHCCNCHSGFIFDAHHECEPPSVVPPAPATLGNYEITWERAARRVGEELTTNGPNGYGDFTAAEWLQWALDTIQTS